MLNLSVQNLYGNQAQVDKLTKSSFYILLEIKMFELLFCIWWKILWAMWWYRNGFPFRIYISWCLYVSFLRIWLENCPSYFRPIAYRQFVNDTFFIFWSKYIFFLFLVYKTLRSVVRLFLSNFFVFWWTIYSFPVKSIYEWFSFSYSLKMYLFISYFLIYCFFFVFYPLKRDYIWFISSWTYFMTFVIQ